MIMQHPQKDEFTLSLKNRLISSIAQMVETDRADDSLCTLSLQSTTYSMRHAWIDTDDGTIRIDLEEWDNEEEWDNAIARVTVESEKLAIDLLKDWLTGQSLEKYSNLSKDYGILTRKLVIA